MGVQFPRPAKYAQCLLGGWRHWATTREVYASLVLFLKGEVMNDQETTKEERYLEVAYLIYYETQHGNGATSQQIKKVLGLNGNLSSIIDGASVRFPIYEDGRHYKMEEFNATYKERARNTGVSESRVRQGEGGGNLLQDGQFGKAWSGLEAAALAADEEAEEIIRAKKIASNDSYKH